MFNQFTDLVLSRQSCRDFNDKPLEKQVVESIVSLALNAPSACNSQPWKVFIVTDKNAMAGVTKAVQDKGMNKFADKAKAFIVITEVDATLKEHVSDRFDRNHFVKYDIGELTAYITLAAQSKGVASCILGWINQQALRSAVGYPETEISNIVIALGYTDIPVREKKRKPQEEIVFNV